MGVQSVAERYINIVIERFLSLIGLQGLVFLPLPLILTYKMRGMVGDYKEV